MVMWAIEHALGGEIFVPKIASYRITDVAKAIGPNCRQEIVGIRPGEKLHEEMITESDSLATIDLGRYYVILPTNGRLTFERYCEHMPAKRVAPGFAYHSGRNSDFLTIDQIRNLIRQHIAADFVPR